MFMIANTLLGFGATVVVWGEALLPCAIMGLV
jgi:hypothetical protein